MAADVDGDGDVDASDSTLLEALVLSESESSSIVPWRFIPVPQEESTVFPDSLGRYEYDGTGRFRNNPEWLLIRVGDLNGDGLN